MNWRSLGKALAVVSALALGGTYVSYRQMQVQKQRETTEPAGEERAVLPGSKSSDRVTILPSSKSIDAVLRNDGSDFILPVEPGAPDSPGTNRDFMIDPTILPEPPADDAKKAEEKKRTLLPSTKLGRVLSPDDAPVKRSDLDEQQKKQEHEEKK